MEYSLVASRFLHYAATINLAGAAFFPHYAYVAPEPEVLAGPRRRLMGWSAVLALISGLAWFVFSVANMSGTLADLVDPEVVASVMRDTGFGVVWTVRMVVASLIVAAVLLRPVRSMSGYDRMISLSAAILLASLAGVGHAQMEEGWQGALHIAADAAHLLAAGAWLGGLLPLGVILLGYARVGGRDISGIDDILLRFSGMGYAAVATLVATGLVNSWILVGSISSLLSSSYGVILTVKLALFAAMLGLAGANRFWLVPALEAAGRCHRNDLELLRGRLRTHVLSEQALGLLVLLCVSVLGTIRPAIGQ